MMHYLLKSESSIENKTMHHSYGILDENRRAHLTQQTREVVGCCTNPTEHGLGTLVNSNTTAQRRYDSNYPLLLHSVVGSVIRSNK